LYFHVSINILSMNPGDLADIVLDYWNYCYSDFVGVSTVLLWFALFVRDCCEGIGTVSNDAAIVL
jgi:hypothetical protein